VSSDAERERELTTSLGAELKRERELTTSLRTELKRERELSTSLGAELKRERELSTSLGADLERELELTTSLRAELERERELTTSLGAELVDADNTLNETLTVVKQMRENFYLAVEQRDDERGLTSDLRDDLAAAHAKVQSLEEDATATDMKVEQYKNRLMDASDLLIAANAEKEAMFAKLTAEKEAMVAKLTAEKEAMVAKLTSEKDAAVAKLYAKSAQICTKTSPVDIQLQKAKAELEKRVERQLQDITNMATRSKFHQKKLEDATMALETTQAKLMATTREFDLFKTMARKAMGVGA
jgi:V/A-type H+-transporting ATPase subunit G/H